MRKLLISFFALFTIMGAWAVDEKPAQLQTFTPGLVPNNRLPKLIGENPQMLTRAGNTYDFGYCAGIGNAIGYPAGYVLEAAIEIPTFMSKSWEGNEIKTVFIGFGCSPNKQINLFITGDMEGEPYYMQEATMTVEALTYNSNGQGVLDQKWNIVELDKPYKIDGNPFYLGFQVLCGEAPCYPIGYDNIYTESEYTSILGAPDGPNGEMIYYDMGSVLGNVCIRFEMDGEVKTQYDALEGPLMLDATLLTPEDEFTSSFTLLNIGDETITDLDMSITLDGVEVEDPVINIYGNDPGSIEFGTLGLVEITCTPPAGVTGADLPLVIKINKLIGKNGSGDFPIELKDVLTVVANGFQRNVVAEEFTGTWCQWCPRGIVGMEYMRKNYGDKGFIGIAIHDDDAMQPDSYSEMLRYFGVNPDTGQLSFPGAVMDRSVYFDPAKETLEEYYNLFIDLPAIGKIDLEATYDIESETINVSSTTEFAVDNNTAHYAVAYVVTEDNVGPYYQQNAFAGGGYGELEGWSDNTKRVRTYYEMVARYIETGFGIEGSIPASVKKQTPYKHSADITMDNIKKNLIMDTRPVIDINNCQVVALLLDTVSGAVINANEVSLKGQAGVEGIFADPVGGIYKVYNPQGVKVLETTDPSELNSLAKGIYIVNGKKVVL